MSLERRAFLAGLLASAFAPEIPVALKTVWYLTPRIGSMMVMVPNRIYRVDPQVIRWSDGGDFTTWSAT